MHKVLFNTLAYLGAFVHIVRNGNCEWRSPPLDKK